METLGQSEPYFVKCIRSNAEKVQCAPSSLRPLWLFRCSFQSITYFLWSLDLFFLKLFIIFPSSLCNLCCLSLFLFFLTPPDASFFFSLSCFLSLFQLPLRFNDNLVLRQLRYTGMLETVHIRQSGYNIKYTFKVIHSITLCILFKHLVTLHNNHLEMGKRCPLMSITTPSLLWVWLKYFITQSGWAHCSIHPSS